MAERKPIVFLADNHLGELPVGDTIPTTQGGTGQTVYAIGDILYASTTTALSRLADIAAGNALISGGVGVAPSWGKIELSTHVTGILHVSLGGSGNDLTSTVGYLRKTSVGSTGFTGWTTIPSTDITGLGTMATQNDNAVAITGGTINGTSVGLTTQAAAAFTEVKNRNVGTGTAASPYEQPLIIGRYSATDTNYAGLFYVNEFTNNNAAYLRVKATSAANVTSVVATFDATGLAVAGRVTVTTYIEATLGLLSGTTPENYGGGTLTLRAPTGSPPFVQFTEHGVAYRGSIGFAAGVAGDMLFKLGGNGFAAGTEYMRLTTTGLAVIGDINSGGSGANVTTYGNRENQIICNFVGLGVADAGAEFAFKGTGTNPFYASVAGIAQGADASGIAGGLAFATKPTTATALPLERMRITAAGVVAVGATGPGGVGSGADLFVVAGAIGTNGAQFNTNYTTNYEFVHRGAGGFHFYTDSGSKLPLIVERFAPTGMLGVRAAGVDTVGSFTAAKVVRADKQSIGVYTVPPRAGSPAYFYVDTKIPFVDGRAPLIRIRGFNYAGANKIVDLSIMWYVYVGTFYMLQYAAVPGTHVPGRIRMDKYTSGGTDYVRIEIDNGSEYWTHWFFEVQDYFGITTDYEGWTVTDNATGIPSPTAALATATPNGRFFTDNQGNATASGAITAGKSLQVADVYALAAVVGAGLTRTLDLANGAVQTITTDSTFTMNFTGPSSKSGHMMLYVYNSSGATISLTVGTGMAGGSTLNTITTVSTRMYPIFWDGTRAWHAVNTSFIGGTDQLPIN